MTQRADSAGTEAWSLTARWIVPGDQPPLARGIVRVAEGKIAAVEPAGAQRANIDLGDAIILPGLVNAHLHLDLTGLRGQAPPSPDFTAWLRQVIAFRRTRTAEQVQADIARGIAECQRFGTTLVGDISSDGASWEALANASIRAIVYREFLGLALDRARAAWRQSEQWLDLSTPTPTCRPGLSPHAPYSVRLAFFAIAARRDVPLATHLAETLDERELLDFKSGPFVPFLQELGAWAPDGLADDFSHVLRVLSGPAPTVLAHGNFLSPEAPVPAYSTVVYCPRTHAAFGHPPHPFRQMLARGVRVALGTDSLASNPDLDLLAEARFVHRLHPDLAGDVLLRMATLSGAEALGWADETGSLSPGKSADLIVVPLASGMNHDDPFISLFQSDTPVSAVLFRGRWVVAPA